MIRSFHRAFSSETTLYTLGNIQLWRPVTARRIFWTAGIVALVWVPLHVARVSLPILSFGWAVAYGVVPFLLGWVFAAGEIEGRKLHVIAPLWVRHRLWHRRALIGGYRVVPARPERVRAGKVRVW